MQKSPMWWFLRNSNPNNYSLIIGGYIQELNSCRLFMAKVSDFWANYLEAVDMAAIASAQWRGLGKKNDADAAAVEAMRKSFDKVPFDGRVAIGEGERDEAPMRSIGEELGSMCGVA